MLGPGLRTIFWGKILVPRTMPVSHRPLSTRLRVFPPLQYCGLRLPGLVIPNFPFLPESWWRFINYLWTPERWTCPSSSFLHRSFCTNGFSPPLPNAPFLGAKWEGGREGERRKERREREGERSREERVRRMQMLVVQWAKAAASYLTRRLTVALNSPFHRCTT